MLYSLSPKFILTYFELFANCNLNFCRSLCGNLVSEGSLKREVLSKVGNLGLRLLEDLTALAAGGSVCAE